MLPVLHPEGCWRPGQIKRPAQNLQLSQDWDFSSLTQSHGSEPLLSAACRPPPGPRRTLPPRSRRWHHCPTNVSFAPAPGLGVGPAAVSGETAPPPEEFTGEDQGAKRRRQLDSDAPVARGSERRAVAGRHGHVLKRTCWGAAARPLSPASRGPARDPGAAPARALPGGPQPCSGVPPHTTPQPLESSTLRHCGSVSLWDHHLGRFAAGPSEKSEWTQQCPPCHLFGPPLPLAPGDRGPAGSIWGNL